MTRKLDEYKVNAIRRERLEGKYSQSNTADAYDVSRKTVYNIEQGTRYANVALPQVKRFSKYAIYPRGKVFSKRTKSVIIPRNNVVRLVTNNGKRETITITALEKLALGIK